ncbi:MAG TPA: Uma2 family endonuclease [Blastocatellia bacterium]|nr:Uma2 family endonuclease [Blastocatellia bacterium]
MSTEAVTSFAPVVTIGLSKNMEALIIRPAPPRERFSDEEFAQFCAEYPDLRVEMNSEGEMIIMLPVVSEGGRKNFLLTGRCFAWVEADGTGVGFDSSAGFTLPNGAKRAPDVSWIRRERWDALSEAEKNEFAPICPDFVIELRSKSDRLATLQGKMAEYLANGASLGWLIDLLEKKVHIYRPGVPADVLDQPSEVSGDPLLKGFVLKLDGIL